MTDLFSAAERTTRQTSIDAMRSVEPRAPNLRDRCWRILNLCGPLTADEVAHRLAEDPLSVRPQFTLLTQEGRIAETGERRRNKSGRMAMVWRAVPAGEERPQTKAALTREDIVDIIADAIDGSMDYDWNSHVGARAIVDALEEEGIIRKETK